METPTDRSQTPQGPERSPRWTERVVHRTAPPGTLPCLEAEVTLLGDAHGSTDPADVTCPQCKEPTRSPERRVVDTTDIDHDLITALGDLTDTYGVAGVRKTMGILWPLEPVTLAAGGFVSGPSPVLVGEKDGPFLSLADHLELARGKTPQAWVNATAETPIDPADVHSDDVMLSAVGCSEPHLGLATTGQLLDEIRARIEMGHSGLNYTTVGGN